MNTQEWQERFYAILRASYSPAELQALTLWAEALEELERRQRARRAR